MLNSTNFVWDIPGAKVGKTWKNRRDFRAPVPPDIGKATCKTAPGIHPCELAPKMWVKSTISSSRIKSHNSSSTTHSNIIKYWLVVKKTILKNDGVRQWEGWHPIYEMETNPRVWNHQPEYHHSRIETKQKDLQGPQGPRACWTETPMTPAVSWCLWYLLHLDLFCWAILQGQWPVARRCQGVSAKKNHLGVSENWVSPK